MNSILLARAKSACLGMAALVIVTAATPLTSVVAQPAAAPAPAGPLPPITDRTVEALTELKTNDPEQLARIVRLLIELKHPEHARPYAKQLLELKLDDDALTQLYKKLGSGTFVQMEFAGSVVPDAKAFAAKVVAAAQKEDRDPAKIEAALDRLLTASGKARVYIRSDLRRAGVALVNPILKRLADPKLGEQAIIYRDTLTAQGPLVVPPLLAALETKNATLAAQVALMLGTIGDAEALPFLIYPSQAPESGAELQAAADRALALLSHRETSGAAGRSLLASYARSYSERFVPFTREDEGKVVVWQWDEGKLAVSPAEFSTDDASLIYAARLARELFALDAMDPTSAQLFLRTQLELASYQAGLGQPVDLSGIAGLDKVDDAVVLEVIETALDGRHTPAAAAGMKLIEERGLKQTLEIKNGRTSLLIRAATHPDRRVRIAAIDTILALQSDPKQSYPGSSIVIDVLGSFIQTSGRPRAVIADNRDQYAQEVAGLLRTIGYEVEMTREGHPFFELAATYADVELALVSSRLAKPPAEYAIASLRKDPRTAWLPVAVLCDTDEVAYAQRVARNDDLAAVIIRPVEATQLEFLLQPLLARRERQMIVSQDERLVQAKRALAHIVKLAEAESTTYDLRRLEKPLLYSLYMPELAADSARALGYIGTPAGQRALVDIASIASQDLAVRQDAAKAFTASVERWGTLLTAVEILRQYERYNESESADADTQEVLGVLLDTIEHGKAKAVADPDAAPKP